MEQEVWKDIEEYKGLYQVSNMGNIKSLAKKRNSDTNGKDIILSITLCTNGYPKVGLIKNTIKSNKAIHRMVAKAFIDNVFNKRCVNHINGIKTDNRVENLEWCTTSENAIHAFKIGLIKNRKGEESPCSKLTNKDIKDIRIRLSNGEYQYCIAKRFNVSQSAISDIKRGKKWSHVREIYKALKK